MPVSDVQLWNCHQLWILRYTSSSQDLGGLCSSHLEGWLWAVGRLGKKKPSPRHRSSTFVSKSNSSQFFKVMVLSTNPDQLVVLVLSKPVWLECTLLNWTTYRNGIGKCKVGDSSQFGVVVSGWRFAFKIFQKVVIQQLEGKYSLERLVGGWVQSSPEQLYVLSCCPGASTEDNGQVMYTQSVNNSYHPTTIVYLIWWLWIGRCSGNVFQVKPSLVVSLKLGIGVIGCIRAPITLVTEADNQSHFPEPARLVKVAGPSFNQVEGIPAVGCPAAFCTIRQASKAIQSLPIHLLVANATNSDWSLPV